LRQAGANLIDRQLSGGTNVTGKRPTIAQQALDEQIARMIRTLRRQRIAIILIGLAGAAIELTTLYPHLY